jgi:hypothetical protein
MPTIGACLCLRVATAGGKPKVRLIAYILAAFVAGGPAAAQDWKKDTFPAYSFSVAFRSDPEIETTTYQLPTAVQSRLTSIPSLKRVVCFE